ncbi:type III-A CRISPR-associated RAMP protein Csm4 [Spirulina sp. CCNP1310]|uniref:type III-A CRISPR-associated RAMP protein Csm4 n=1 Tax=Spirulina sp. CCNP1310 TaxID=3110249 RepID=UPI002B20AC20|nr:type III-A CRISPR-associated RAMP protein Csm4 [Spirulina sp. CCNP1310]
MDNWYLVRLDFGQNVAHFGRVGIGLEETSDRLPSDSLFSALISTYARIYPEHLGSLLDAINGPKPPFRHSSTFIYVRNQETYRYYLPKPLSFPKNYQTDDNLTLTKAYKKLAYLPLEVWQSWYQGEGFTKADGDEIIAHAQAQSSQENRLQKLGMFDYGKTHRTAKLPKVSLDRITQASNFYHTKVVQFQCEFKEAESQKTQSGKRQPEKQAGLYFLLHFPQANPELMDQLKTVLSVLADEGIGGERSSGAGRFTLDWVKTLPEAWRSLLQFAKPNAYSLLSLFWNDQKDELSQIKEDKNARYEFQDRGGWVSSSPTGIQERRKKVRMFSEGSVFAFPPQGRLADVTPPRFNAHPVYRSGLALSLPISIDLQ